MTFDLYVLAGALILAIVQILAFDIVRTAQYGLKWNIGPRDQTDLPELSLLGSRLKRAQDNLFETLPIFIGAILIVHVAGKAGYLSGMGSHIWLIARILYVPLYAMGVTGLRSIVWIISMVGLGMVIAAMFV